MSVHHPKRQPARKWYQFATVMLAVALFALAAVVALIAVELRTLVIDHGADKQQIRLLTMVSDAAELVQRARAEHRTTLSALPAAITDARARADAAMARVLEDSTAPTSLSNGLRELARSGQAMATAIRGQQSDRIGPIEEDLLDGYDALRQTGRSTFDMMVHREDAAAVAAAKWLVGLGAVSVAALLLIVALVWSELGLRQRVISGVAQAREAVARAERTRARFLQAVGHDLRQPLQAIMLFATGLERRVHDDEALSLLGNLRSAVDSMQRMLSGLMEVSRLDAGVVAPEPVILAVADILRPLATEFFPLAADKGILFTIQPSDLSVKTDPVMTECILRNLISNAVRFTRSGEVVVLCRSEGDTCVIEVTDSGPGIADEEKTRIFQEFYRVAATARHAEGLGLGLAIVKRMVNLLGAHIELRSIVGVGTTFMLSLPRAAGSAPLVLRAARRGDSEYLLAGARVLLVDDDAQLAQALAPELTSRGMSVVVMHHPDMVCALFEENRQPAFDIALVDRDLNAEMTGPKLLDHLAAHFKVVLPALVLSGTTDFLTIQELQNCDYPWLAKPVPLSTLLREMGRVLEADMPLRESV